MAMLDKQHRIMIGQKIFDLLNYNEGEELFLCFIDDTTLEILNSSQLYDGCNILSLVKMDNKKRIVIPSEIRNILFITDQTHILLYANKKCSDNFLLRLKILN